MSDDVRSTPVRLRLTIRPQLADTLERVSNGLDLEPNAVATFALSLGLRVLNQITNPDFAAAAQVMSQKADTEIAAAVDDANIAHRVKQSS